MQASKPNDYRTKTISTKLTGAEAHALKEKAAAAHIPVSTFVRSALLKSRLRGVYVPTINQEAWVKLSNLEDAVRGGLANSPYVDDVTLAAFLNEMAKLRQMIVGRRP